MSIKNYLFQMLVAFDRLVNASIGGDAGETLSSVAYRKHRDNKPTAWACAFIDRLFYEGHCADSYRFDRAPKLQK